MQRSQFVEGGSPFTPTGLSGVPNVHVAVVVYDIPGDDQSKLGHVQRRAVVGIGVPGFDDLEAMPLQLEVVCLEPLGYANRVGNLAGKPGSVRIELSNATHQF